MKEHTCIKVAQVFNFDPANAKAKGVPIFLIKFLDELRKKGVRVTVIGRKYNPRDVDWLSYTFYPLFVGNKSSPLKFGLKLFLYGNKYVTDDTIINVHRLEYLLAFFLRNNPKVVTYHTNMRTAMFFRKGWLFGSFYALMETLVLRYHKWFNIKAIVFVSTKLKNDYVNLYPSIRENCVVLPFGCDKSVFRVLRRTSLRKKWGLPRNSRLFLYVGRLVKEKQVDILVRAFNKLNLNRSKFLIVGDGQEKPNLLPLASESVHFLGEQTLPLICELYNCADCTLVGSRFEGGPITIFESLACGTPVISTPVGAAVEVIENGINGYIVNNQQELIDRMRQVVTMKENIRRRCVKSVKEFNPRNMALGYISLYHRFQE
ncbi:MAG: glycosyltransferase family 4 protein [Candidatus Woesearchaeota archaeon]